MRWWSARGLSMAMAALCMAGCGPKQGQGPPQPSSAASQSGFAAAYAGTLQKDAEQFDAARDAVTEASAEFATYADRLKDPCDYATAETVVRAADEAGRSEAFVQAARQRDAVEAFFGADEGARMKRLAGGVQYAVKQAGCAEASHAAAGTVKRQIEKDLSERTRSGNEAHAMLDRRDEELGRDNVKAMRSQVDAIAEASYLVHIALPTRKRRFERHVRSGAEARKTLEREIASEERRSSESGGTDKAKQASKARVSMLEEAKGKLDVQLEEAKTRLKTLDKEMKDAKAAYDEALDALLAALRTRAEAGGAS